MFGVVRTGVLARQGIRAAQRLRGYKKQSKDAQAEGEEDVDAEQGADPDFQLLDIKIATAEFLKYWKMPEKPVTLKRTPEQYTKEREYIREYTRLSRNDEAAYVKLAAEKQLHTWEAIFELPPRLFREAVVIDHTVIPTYQPWTDTPPDPKFKHAKPPEDETNIMQ